MLLLQKSNKCLNILFLAPRYHTNQNPIVSLLENKGHKIFFHSKYIGKIENHDNIKPLVFEESFFSRALKLIFFFKKDKHLFYLPKLIKYYLYLKKLNFDIAIIRLHGRLNVYILSVLIRFILNKKVIFYDQANSDLRHIKGLSILKIIKKIEFYTRLFLFSARWFTPLHNKKNILPKNCYYVPFYVQNRPFIKKNFKKIKILTIAKFQNRKNLLKATQIINFLKDKYNLEFTIVGEVSKKEHEINLIRLEKYIREKNLEQIVSIFTNVSNNEIKNFYINHNLFFLPSYNEPASISLLEAMSYGLPVICHKTCGTSTYVKNGFNGFVLNNISFNEINLILDKIKNIQTLEVLSKNCLHYQKQYFSDKVYYNHFLNLINSFTDK